MNSSAGFPCLRTFAKVPGSITITGKSSPLYSFFLSFLLFPDEVGTRLRFPPFRVKSGQISSRYSVMSRPINGKTVLDSSSRIPSRGQTNLNAVSRSATIRNCLPRLYIYIYIREKFQARSAGEADICQCQLSLKRSKRLETSSFVLYASTSSPSDNHSNPPIGIEQVIGQDSLIDHR